VNPKHSEDSTLMLLAKKRKDPAAVVTSVCAQCHVRTGKSRSSGLPYPNSFVAGDNLFRDLQVDFSDAGLKALNPVDRHVQENIRDVVVSGKEDVTCLSCHNVHQSSGKKHHRVAESPLCHQCHEASGSKKARKSYEVHSETCGY
jgi:predicted CXXCH cytochrome family protein